jgi:uncharacterized coiled-coil DUF342 family protein
LSEKRPAQELLEAKLQETDAEIDKLDARLRQHKANSELRDKLARRLQEIRDRRAELNDRITALKQKTATSFEELGEGVQDAWHELSSAVKRAADELK